MLRLIGTSPACIRSVMKRQLNFGFLAGALLPGAAVHTAGGFEHTTLSCRWIPRESTLN
jgi:hypothetical protein